MDGLLRVTTPHEWALLVGLGLALLGIVAWSVFGSIERSLAADCVLARSGERYPVVAEVTGRVIEALAQEGDAVEAGQPIARVRMSQLDREIRVARSRVSLLEEQVAQSDDAGVEGVLAAARAELLELEARRESGELIVSSHSGVVAIQSLTPGQEVTAGNEVALVRTGGDDRIEAVALVSPEDVRRMAVGMESQVIRHGEAGALPAEVSHISERALVPSSWPVFLGLTGGEGSRLVRLSLSEPPTAGTDDGAPCRIRVILREDPPYRLLVGSIPVA